MAGIETIATGGWHTVALNKQNQVWVWGGNWYGQVGLGNIDNESTCFFIRGCDLLTAKKY
ncbi:RCC1 domain-containing protein [Peptococcaceae bacterium]|nr:RCC1 domain-containing protein [Peptococcaceae bacterium]